jgi:hypothetical protein
MDPISSTEIENRIGIFFKRFTQSFPASTSQGTVKSLGGLAPECISSLSVRLPERTHDYSGRLPGHDQKHGKLNTCSNDQSPISEAVLY